MENEKIARRHMHAMVLSMFFREHPDRFKSVKNFFFDTKENVCKEVERYITANLEGIVNAMKKVIPEQSYEDAGHI